MSIEHNQQQPAAAQEAVGVVVENVNGEVVSYSGVLFAKFILSDNFVPGMKLYAAPVTAAPVGGRDVRSAIAGLEGSVAVGSDGEWVSVRRAARDAAVMALRNVSLDCAHIYAAYSEAKASTPAAPGIDLAALRARVVSAIERITSGAASMRIPADMTDPDLVLGDVLCLLDSLGPQTDASHKGGGEARALLGALVSLVAVARRYLPDYDEHPEVQKADDAIDAAMQAQAQAGDAEVQP